MSSSLFTFILAVSAVTLAEMGDKTQLLAMAFATKYKASKVLIGVFIATILNHALAVAVGNLITKVAALDIWIQGLAALSFIFFGLWTIRGDKLDGEENKTTKYGAILTVAIAFFIAELGDKTQLTTIAIAAKYPENPVAILMGTTTGMIIADSIGIIVGVVMCKRIPERTVKLVSAGAFILFGLIATYQLTSVKLALSTPMTILILSIVSLVTAGFAAYLIKNLEPTENPAVENCCKIVKTEK